MRTAPGDPDYPEVLLALPDPPILRTSGPLVPGRAVAVVGSRRALDASLAFARTLAGALAKAGFTVVSGGAHGVDRAAHEAALDAGGRTWLVAPCGPDHVYPPNHADLFRRVASSAGSAVLWPFPEGTRTTRETPRTRNKTLVCLSEAVTVIQASLRSGSRNAARWARDLGRPVWVVPGPPWEYAFAGSVVLLEREARPLGSIELFLRELESPRPKTTRVPSGEISSNAERVVYSCLSDLPRSLEQVVQRAGVGAGLASSALLTLSLKNVVVEGPEGCFRRNSRG